MGPTMPWLAEWKSYGLNFLAGVAIENPEYLTQTCAEGGGTRIFNGGVQYRLLSLD